MFKNQADYHEYLKGLDFEELLDPELLVCFAQEEINSRLEYMRSRLERMSYAELLGDLIEELVEEEINERLELYAKVQSDLDQNAIKNPPISEKIDGVHSK